ncbi:hypothetical protein NMY22_g11416 [Coprinellus aureogranulatus]|nr:hypothetical protein NMY22_g11416 [Coprinellus aureogranulatus]
MGSEATSQKSVPSAAHVPNGSIVFWLKRLAIVGIIFAFGSYLDSIRERFYVFDPKSLHQLSQAAIAANPDNLPGMIDHIVANLTSTYPSTQVRLNYDNKKWVFNNAGGAMGAMYLIHASITEYLIIFGTPLGTEYGTNRYTMKDGTCRKGGRDMLREIWYISINTLVTWLEEWDMWVFAIDTARHFRGVDNPALSSTFFDCRISPPFTTSSPHGSSFPSHLPRRYAGRGECSPLPPSTIFSDWSVPGDWSPIEGRVSTLRPTCAVPFHRVRNRRSGVEEQDRGVLHALLSVASEVLRNPTYLLYPQCIRAMTRWLGSKFNALPISPLIDLSSIRTKSGSREP